MLSAENSAAQHQRLPHAGRLVDLQFALQWLCSREPALTAVCALTVGLYPATVRVMGRIAVELCHSRGVARVDHFPFEIGHVISRSERAEKLRSVEPQRPQLVRGRESGR